MFGITFLPIGLGLEVAKLVAARRLRQGDLTGGLRATLIALIAICMAVTTVGIYGFISRCYTDRIATMTPGSDHDLAAASERLKVAEQSLAGIDQQIAPIDAPETKTVKVKVAGRTTETTVPVVKDQAGRA